uniref:Uncharacterized protein n=1 Tax=Anguilla anguilla TaxID=7936 RepID=A0A0E9TR42_ANGAN
MCSHQSILVASGLWPLPGPSSPPFLFE